MTKFILGAITSVILGSINLGFASTTPDWTENYVLPKGETRANLYNVSVLELEQLKNNGYLHAMNYPVTVTGLLIPYEPLLNFMSADTKNPLKKFILNISRKFAGFKTEAELYEWLGLNKFNDASATGIYKMPRPAN
ncbi:MAG: hypothetical protein H7336_10310, partial [Bacteriovorax sp.]|nr:hypothetical protein [Bacteriovorax sp.]